MNYYITEESYSASTKILQDKPNELEKLSIYRNSKGAFQLLLFNEEKNHFILDNQFSIPDEIEIPIYRIKIQSELPIQTNFIEYYYGNDDIEYADKVIEETSHTYSGDRFAPIYIELPVDDKIKPGNYKVDIEVYKSEITEKEELIVQSQLDVEVLAYSFPDNITKEFNLDIWQQPSNLARTFEVDLWGENHFRLISEMANKLSQIGQKAITIIGSEVPWKGWFNYIVKDYPANLYEYSMIQVKKDKYGNIYCDFDILERYLECFFEAGIDKEINLFGFLGVWQPPFFPLVDDLEYPENILVRYYNEDTEIFEFINKKEELLEYFQQVFNYFKEAGLWDKVRIISDEPKFHEVDKFKKSLSELKELAPDLITKVAFDKEPVMEALLPMVDYPVTSYYCTCQNHKELSKSHPGKTQYYICNYPDRPNTFLHSPLLESRLQGTLAYHFKTDGMLRWAFNCWPNNALEDIRYNTDNLPIGDLSLVYPSKSGKILTSLRMKQLYRGIEDFYLLKEAEKTNKSKTKDVINEFLKTTETEKWMIDSHTSNPNIFKQTNNDYDFYRKNLIKIIEN